MMSKILRLKRIERKSFIQKRENGDYGKKSAWVYGF